MNSSTAQEVSTYGVISGPYFPAFGQNTKRYEVSLRIQSECGKIRTKNNSVFEHFSRSVKATEVTHFYVRIHSNLLRVLLCQGPISNRGI